MVPLTSFNSHGVNIMSKTNTRENRDVFQNIIDDYETARPGYPADLYRDIVEYAGLHEGAKILEEGVAQRSSDIDVIYLNGYGFPAFRGGPMYYADSVGLDKVLARVKELHARCGDWWKPAPLLEKLAAEGRTFTEWQAGQ